MVHKSGFVGIVGIPNVGKSTLLNSLINQKLSIVSSKSQTTRNNVFGILDDKDYQIVFTDMPGYHSSKYKLGEYMMKSIISGINDVDMILFVTNFREKILDSEIEILKKIENRKVPKVFILNKVDDITDEQLFKMLERYKNVFNFDKYIHISALKRINLDKLLDIILKHLPEGPKYYQSGEISTNDERFFVSEFIREKVLKFINHEIPHGVGIDITLMKYDSELNRYNIEGNIICEKETHKPIIIGKNGEMMKKISTYSRYDIERFLGCKVYLRLWVKVRKNWRDNNNQLKTLGYK